MAGAKKTRAPAARKQTRLQEAPSTRGTPAREGDVTLVLGTGPACGEAHAICTSDGRRLSAPLTVIVPGVEEEDDDNAGTTPTPLTARFVDPPKEHENRNFSVYVESNADIRTSYRYVHEAVLGTGGEAKSASRVDGRSDLWKIRVTPDVNSNVILSVRVHRSIEIANEQGPRGSDSMELIKEKRLWTTHRSRVAGCPPLVDGESDRDPSEFSRSDRVRYSPRLGVRMISVRMGGWKVGPNLDQRRSRQRSTGNASSPGITLDR